MNIDIQVGHLRDNQPEPKKKEKKQYILPVAIMMNEEDILHGLELVKENGFPDADLLSLEDLLKEPFRNINLSAMNVEGNEGGSIYVAATLIGSIILQKQAERQQAHYSLYATDSEGKPLLVIQERPEQKFFFKGQEIEVSQLVAILEAATVVPTPEQQQEVREILQQQEDALKDNTNTRKRKSIDKA